MAAMAPQALAVPSGYDAEEGTAMTGPRRNRIQTQFTTVDTALADRQWAEWRATRRGVLKSAGLTAGALSIGGGRF
jgi:hypothetical protein